VPARVGRRFMCRAGFARAAGCSEAEAATRGWCAGTRAARSRHAATPAALAQPVASSCTASIAAQVRRALVEVLDSVAAAQPPGAAPRAPSPPAAFAAAPLPPPPLAAPLGGPDAESRLLPPTLRLSHVGLNKLYALASRGQDLVAVAGGEPGAGEPGSASRAQFEVGHARCRREFSGMRSCGTSTPAGAQLGRRDVL
jgi:hypothetical protein